MEHRARKRFGQNFLHDPGIIRSIVNAIHPGPDDHLVEIGPGLAAITRPVLEEGPARLDVVELDRDLLPGLNTLATLSEGRMQVHAADALKFDFAALQEGERPLRVIGNLPYNISTPLIFHLLEQAACIRDMHFMLQQEVVERLAARPGGKDYGRLSVMVQFYCKVENLFTVPPGAFNPPPKVYSAIVRLTPIARPEAAGLDHRLLQQVVTASFAQRRKTLRNNLKKHLTGDALQALGIDPGRRAETLELQEFINITRHLQEHDD